MNTIIFIIIIEVVFSLYQSTDNKMVKYETCDNYSLKDDINNSIIDGFYDNDTTGIGDKIYLQK